MVAVPDSPGHPGCSYGSVKKMLAAACAASGARHVEGTVPLPLRHPDEVVAVVAASLPAGARLAVFDAVTSNTALVLPLPQLVQLCRTRCACIVGVVNNSSMLTPMLPAISGVPTHCFTNWHHIFVGYKNDLSAQIIASIGSKQPEEQASNHHTHTSTMHY